MQDRTFLTGSVSVLAAGASAATNGDGIARPYADVGYIFASTSANNATFKLQDSADDSSYADVDGVTFDVAAGESGKLAFDAGHCRAYVRVVGTPDAASDISAWVVFADVQNAE